MRIVVKDSGSSRIVRLKFPLRLVLNGFTACFVPWALRGSEVKITRRQAVRLIKELRRCKKRFPGWKIVEVESANGWCVEVRV